MPGVLACLKGCVELLLGQAPTLEEKGLQLLIINGIFINRLPHPLSRALKGDER